MPFSKLLIVLLLGWSQTAFAVGVFDLPRFVTQGNMAVGLEPEVNLGTDAGAAINLHYTYGLNDLINLKGILGTGSSARAFRFGLSSIFDIFPDVSGQPGIGLAFTGMYYRVSDSGQVEFMLTPYIHKAFPSGSKEFEPFVALPFGLSVNQGVTKGISTLSIGAMFKQWDRSRFILEVGVAINNSNTYASGGFVFFP